MKRFKVTYVAGQEFMVVDSNYVNKYLQFYAVGELPVLLTFLRVVKIIIIIWQAFFQLPMLGSDSSPTISSWIPVFYFEQ